MSKSKSNVSGKRKRKASRSRTKNNGNARTQYVKDNMILTDDESENSSKTSNPKSPAAQDAQEDNEQNTSELNTLKKNTITNSGVSNSQCEDKHTELGTPENLQENDKNYRSIPDDSKDDCVHISSSDNFSSSNELPMKNYTVELFESIYSGKLIPKLPNRLWSIHCVDIPERCIVISEVALRQESGAGLAPLYNKQILFDEKMNYELFLLNSRAVIKSKLYNVATIDDVAEVITYTENLKLCRGGPEVSTYLNVNPECAYRDSKERWRHNLCSLEVSVGESCESCDSLDEILRRYVQRNRQTTKSRGGGGSTKRRRVAQS